MKEPHPYKTISSRVVYKNSWIRVREDKIIRPGGGDGIYSVVESNNSVMVVVLNDKDEVYMVRAYSYPVQAWSWELPGGGGDGEEAVTASRRELMEETGIDAKDWTLLGKTRVCNGLMTERQSTYLARGLTMTGNSDPEDAAIVSRGKFFGIEEVRKMIQDGKIDSGQSLTGLYLLEQWLNPNPHALSCA